MTHGPQGCFEQKSRQIRHLVPEPGFRTVVFEADFAPVTALDEFVRDDDSFGSGDNGFRSDDADRALAEKSCEWARVRHEEPGPHPTGMRVRDRFMAENAHWALEQDPGAGVMLWAHGGHVQRGTVDDGTVWADVPTMGERLARELGEDYRPIGFDFARGSFRAVGAGSGEVGTVAVDPPGDDSATAAFAAVGETPYLLDLDATAGDDRLEQWLDAEPRTRHVGSVFDPAGRSESGYSETNLPASFDCLLFLPTSTPTRPISGE
ncbi:MAG: erythromycin esterase family protein [Halolamina sp.]